MTACLMMSSTSSLTDNLLFKVFSWVQLKTARRSSYLFLSLFSFIIFTVSMRGSLWSGENMHLSTDLEIQAQREGQLMKRLEKTCGLKIKKIYIKTSYKFSFVETLIIML